MRRTRVAIAVAGGASMRTLTEALRAAPVRRACIAATASRCADRPLMAKPIRSARRRRVAPEPRRSRYHASSWAAASDRVHVQDQQIVKVRRHSKPEVTPGTGVKDFRFRVRNKPIESI